MYVATYLYTMKLLHIKNPIIIIRTYLLEKATCITILLYLFYFLNGYVHTCKCTIIIANSYVLFMSARIIISRMTLKALSLAAY